MPSALPVPSSSFQAAPQQRAQRALVFYRADPASTAADHDVATKMRVAERLAQLLGYEFGGDFAATSASADAAQPYFVPSDTLPDLACAARLGIRDSSDLFGGVVPHPFVATKVISHGLVDAHAAAAPIGWSAGFSQAVDGAVLPGYSVFSAADARRAAALLLEGGAIRAKDPAGVGGVGQWVLADGAALESLLAAIDPATLARHGLVLERNLTDVVTHSVGHVQVGEMAASYCGVQSATPNHHGESVYGGSDLLVARGGFEQLLCLDLQPEVRLAVGQALSYQRAAMTSFGGMFASRCNYDVAQGLDDRGVRQSGVLEQSWRIGGASGAEVAALQAFAADQALNAVRASTCERYGDDVTLPPGAWVLYDGVDRRVGRVTKYALTAPHAST